jgi:hypothetical protein
VIIPASTSAAPVVMSSRVRRLDAPSMGVLLVV